MGTARRGRIGRRAVGVVVLMVAGLLGLVPSGSKAAVGTDIIRTFAGDGNGWDGALDEGGPATETNIPEPRSIAAGPAGSPWAGSVFFSSHPGRIYRVRPDGIIERFAGGGGAPADGANRLSASFGFGIRGIDVGADGSVYAGGVGVTNELYRIDPAGTVHVITMSETIADPYGIAVDGAGNVYVVAGSEGRIVRVAPNGDTSTFFGQEKVGCGRIIVGPAEDRQHVFPWGYLENPRDVELHDGNLYVVDYTEHLIMKVPVSNPAAYTHVAGRTLNDDGTCGSSSDTGLFFPKTVAVNGTGMYFPGSGARVYRNSTGEVVAGTGTSGYSGDGGPAASAQIETPNALAVDSFGRLYIGQASRIRCVACPAPAPDTEITDGPAPGAVLTTNKATFSFSSPVAGVTFQCAVDAGAFSSCTSPHTTQNLAAGNRTFRVRALNQGTPDATPAERSFKMAPQTTITGGPANNAILDESNSVSYSFTSGAPGVTFLCGFGPASTNPDFTSCTSPFQRTGLSDGSYKFSVKARVGNVNDPTPASRIVIIDNATPVVTKLTGPSGTISSTSATFTFSASEPSTFRCSLNGATPTTCKSGIKLSGLSDRAHTFVVTGIDIAGRTSAPVQWDFVVEARVPAVTKLSGPSGTITTNEATFTFQASEAATFQCSLDGADWSSCASGIELTGLSEGFHRFKVMATDAAGKISAPVKWEFIVDLP